MVLRSHELPSDYEDDDFQWTSVDELASGERICPPSKEPRSSTFVPALIVVVAGLVAGWAAAQFPDATQAVKSAASALMTASTTASAPPAEPLARQAAEAALPPPPVETQEVASVPGADAGEAAPPAVPVVEPEAVAVPDETSAPTDASVAVEPLAKPVADPADPNQKRALAAGLHPDVSKALLARMTSADYNNARDAVRTALAETDDGAVLTWPRSGGTAGAAVFEVKFVAGSASGCRRYVVIVTKDRWSTTAPPMEACGAELPKRKMAAKIG